MFGVGERLQVLPDRERDVEMASKLRTRGSSAGGFDLEWCLVPATAPGSLVTPMPPGAPPDLSAPLPATALIGRPALLLDIASR